MKKLKSTYNSPEVESITNSSTSNPLKADDIAALYVDLIKKSGAGGAYFPAFYMVKRSVDLVPIGIDIPGFLLPLDETDSESKIVARILKIASAIYKKSVISFALTHASVGGYHSTSPNDAMLNALLCKAKVNFAPT